MIARIAAVLAVATWSVAGVAAVQDVPASEPVVGLESSAPLSSPGDPLAQLLDDGEARLRAELELLQQRRAAAEEALARERAEHADRTEKIVDGIDRVQSAVPGSAEADALYDEIVAALQNLRPRVREALARWGDPIVLPDVGIDLDPAVRSTPAFEARSSSLEAILAAIQAESVAVERAERDARWAAIALRAVRVDRLNALRTDCLAKLSFAKRQRTLSVFSEEGINQLRREIDQLTLSSQVWAVRREHRVYEIPERMRDVFRVGSVTWNFVKLVALLVALVWVRRRWKAWIEEVRQSLFRRASSVRSKRRVETVLGAMEVLGPWALVLGALGLARHILGGFQDVPEAELGYRVAFAYGAYRLGIDAAYALIVSAAARYRLSLDESRHKKLFESVRAVARLAAAIAVLLALSALLLGKGYLYHFIVRFAWIFGAVIAVRLLGRWREEIGEAYLKVQPTGRLADAVRRTREKWYGIFVAGASFVWLFGRGVAVLARDFALGFDQTRRALAFLFRKRIEKQAEQRGYAETSFESLPSALREAFRPGPVSDGDLVIDQFPALETLRQAVTEWKAGRGGGAFLIHGPTGIGKTSWLRRLRAEGIETETVVLDERPGTASRLAETLAATLLPAGSGVSDVEALADALRGGPPRIVTVDVAHNLFLSRVGGYEAFSALTDLVSATHGRVLWVCAFNGLALQHLAAVRPELSVFRHRAALLPWSEPKIRDLIHTRLEASDVQASYEDLVVDRMEGVSAQATLLQTEEGYTRLLWDYADGIPRVALHFWLRSVVPESEHRVRVRLFRAPDAELLEGGGQAGLFVMAAVVSHENLTLQEAVQVTDLPESICRIHTERFLEFGALSRNKGRFRLSTHWQQAAIRLLRRRNLLPD